MTEQPEPGSNAEVVVIEVGADMEPTGKLQVYLGPKIEKGCDVRNDRVVVKRIGEWEKRVKPLAVEALMSSPFGISYQFMPDPETKDDEARFKQILFESFKEDREEKPGTTKVEDIVSVQIAAVHFRYFISYGKPPARGQLTRLCRSAFRNKPLGNAKLVQSKQIDDRAKKMGLFFSK